MMFYDREKWEIVVVGNVYYWEFVCIVKWLKSLYLVMWFMLNVIMLYFCNLFLFVLKSSKIKYVLCNWELSIG